MNELHKISGVVVRGESRGKTLGFPTANIRLSRKIPEGIYASTVSLNGSIYRAASFIGAAKTFQQKEVKLETYLFDFERDIYGRRIIVRLYKKIRGNKKFDSVEELVERMKKDVEEIKEFFVKDY
jgi:riboflavin kinase / FMN adenylyltransferase